MNEKKVTAKPHMQRHRSKLIEEKEKNQTNSLSSLIEVAINDHLAQNQNSILEIRAHMA